MKNTKKLLAIVLAVVMVLALSVSAFAATTTYTVTMKTSSGHDYTAYQIFAGDLSADGKTLSNITWGTGVNGDNLLNALKNDATYGAAFADCDTAADVAEVLATYKDKAADVEALAKIIAANKQGDGTEAVDTEITGLTAGYYLIIDTTDEEDMPEGNTYSSFMLEVVKNVEVTAKDSTTTSEKKVKDVNDSEADSLSDWQDSADYDIGDKVPFQLTANIAGDYDKYNEYELTFHDEQSAGLSFNAESVKVYVDGNLIETGYTVKTAANTNHDELGEDTFQIVFENLKDIPAVKAGSKITVEYTSTLNENAETGEAGNPNEMYIEYSNNPNDDQKGKTEKDKVVVFTYEFDVNKVDKDHNQLDGAEFTLYKFDATKNEYVQVGDVKTGDESAHFEWRGLDDGQYKLVETKTPDGYNTMKDLEFTIDAEHDVDSADPQLIDLTIDPDDIGFDPDVESGVIEGDIVNLKGSELPSTGGIGTTIFTVVGSILVIGAAVLLIAKKRTAAEE